MSAHSGVEQTDWPAESEAAGLLGSPSPDQFGEAAVERPAEPGESNAEKMIRSEDWKRRSAASQKGWANPKARKKASASGKKAWKNASPERRIERVAATTEALHRPEVKKLLVDAQALLSDDPEVGAHKSAGKKKWWGTKAGRKQRKLMSKGSKKAWSDPEEAKRMKAAMKASSSRLEVQENRSVAMKEVSGRPEVRKGRKASVKKSWDLASPEERKQRLAPMLAASRDPEVLKKISATQTQKWADPEEGQRRRAAMKEIQERPDVQSKMKAGRLKGAAVTLASRGGAHFKNARMIDQAAASREKYRLKHGKPQSWPLTLKAAIDPEEFAAMSPEERKAAADRLRLAVTYWERKGQSEKTAFSPPAEGVGR